MSTQGKFSNIIRDFENAEGRESRVSPEIVSISNLTRKRLGSLSSFSYEDLLSSIPVLTESLAKNETELAPYVVKILSIPARIGVNAAEEEDDLFC